jgi:hypothetical protein
MGTDMRTMVEVQVNDKWTYVADIYPFEWRDYGLFGFLADVRNYSFVPPLGPCKYVLPLDTAVEVSAELANDDEAYNVSWFTLNELIAFDYGATFEDRRTTKQLSPGSYDGGADTGPGNGIITTFRDFLGTRYFADLDELKTLGDADKVRIIFWFS